MLRKFQRVLFNLIILFQVKHRNLESGLNARNVTRRLLRTLVKPILAIKFSFSARKGKRLFREAMLWALVCATVVTGRNGSSKKSIELATGDFLKRANDSVRNLNI